MYVVVLIHKDDLGKVTLHPAFDDAVVVGTELVMDMNLRFDGKCPNWAPKDTREKVQKELKQHQNYIGPTWAVYIGIAE